MERGIGRDIIDDIEIISRKNRFGEGEITISNNWTDIKKMEVTWWR
jgi:hypothetical protein